MTTYAKTTDVPVEKSRAEIEAALMRFGADQFMYGWDKEQNRAVLSFRIHGRSIRLEVPLPGTDAKSIEKLKVAAAGLHVSKQPDALHQQALRQRWRAMLLYVKAVLEAIENELIDIDEAFLYGMVLPNNQTFKGFYQDQIAAAIELGEMPPALPAPRE